MRPHELDASLGAAAIAQGARRRGGDPGQLVAEDYGVGLRRRLDSTGGMRERARRPWANVPAYYIHELFTTSARKVWRDTPDGELIVGLILGARRPHPSYTYTPGRPPPPQPSYRAALIRSLSGKSTPGESRAQDVTARGCHQDKGDYTRWKPGRAGLAIAPVREPATSLQCRRGGDEG